MTDRQTQAIQMFRKASWFRDQLHEAQDCRLDSRWQMTIWTAKEEFVVEAVTLAPEMFEWYDDKPYSDMVLIKCRANGLGMHFPRRKMDRLNPVSWNNQLRRAS